MALSLPAFTTDLSFPFLYLRKMMGSLATAGVVNPSTDFIVSPSSGLQVQITSGVAFVQQTINVEGSSAYNGLYMVLNDATANPFNTITAPVSNSRIDQVILRVYDVNEQGLGGSSKAQLEWLVGTESASASLATMGPSLSNPGAATLPDNSLRIAYVLQTVGEASISSGNILNVAPSATHPSRGATNIATSQSTSSTSFTTLATPDQVTGIVLPTNGLILVSYAAAWQASAAAGQAAIFLNSTQMQVQGWDTVTGHEPLPEAAVCPQTNLNQPLFSFAGGLASGDSGTAFSGDVTTGQAVGFINSSGSAAVQIGATTSAFQFTNTTVALGGPCYIFAAAGTYTVSVQFKASSGSVTASNRKLWVQAISFG